MRGRARFPPSAPGSVIGCQKGLGIKRPAVHFFNARTVGVAPPVALAGDHNVIDPHFGDTAAHDAVLATAPTGSAQVNARSSDVPGAMYPDSVSQRKMAYDSYNLDVFSI